MTDPADYAEKIARESHRTARWEMHSLGIDGVPLTNRARHVVAVALVDMADSVGLKAVRWSRMAAGYAYHPSGYMHRIVLALTKGDGVVVDHRNGDKLDNRRSNLRTGTQGDNLANVVLSNPGRSRFRGVAWCNHMNKWRAYSRSSGRQVWLGYHDTEEDAAEAARRHRAAHRPFTVEDRKPDWPSSFLRMALAGDWEDLPEANRATMLATFRGLIKAGVIVPGPAVTGSIEETK